MARSTDQQQQQQHDEQIAFGPFRMDRANARLLRGDEPVSITPKSFDVLHYLACRPQRLVTKDELLSAVWPDVIVSDASIKVCVREIRQVLGDDVKTPKYIETVHRRGYRFVGGAGRDSEPPRAAEGTEPPEPPLIAPSPPPPGSEPLFVGREAEMRQLAQSLARAAGGERRVVLVSGGPGTGKTALVEGFCREAEDGATVLVGRCFEQFGTAEPYLPVWEAIGRVSRARQSAPLQGLLARHAAAYGASAPPDASGPPGAASVPRGMSERMLREIADALESLAAEAPLVLALEDVHWADFSTLDLVSALARRRTPARLLVVVTYRPAEVVAEKHPLRDVVQGLLSAGLCSEVRLDFLDEPAVAEYLAARFPGHALPPALARRLHQRTEGHPLFLSQLVSDLVDQGVLVERNGRWHVSVEEAAAGAGGDAGTGPEAEPPAWLAVLDTHIPVTVRAMIELQFERLAPHEQQALEAGAVAGVECSGAAVAAALGEDVVRAEQRCEDLARRQLFLQAAGADEWPDGTVATHFRFVHELYHNAVYERIPVARRVRLHQTLGSRLEAAWASRPAEMAAELAMHFELGRDWPRAVKYLRQAADAANRQHAHREAVSYLRRALAALDRLPPEQRGEHELALLQSLGVNLQVTRGFAAPEVEEVHARAFALCTSGASSPDIASSFPVLWGIWVFHKVRSDLLRAMEMAHRLLSMARDAADPALLLQAHQAMCVTALCSGDPTLCTEHMGQATALYQADRHAGNTQFYGQDPGVATMAFGSVSLWLQGRVEESLRAGDKSVELARQLSQPSSLSIALHFRAMLSQLRGDAEATETATSEAVALAGEEGFSFWHAGGRILHGWARAARGDAATGVRQIQGGLDAWLDTGSRTYLTYYLGLLADALLRDNRPVEALAHLDWALAAAHEMPEGLYEAELHRLRARALLRVEPSGAGNDADAIAALRESLEVARRQRARFFEVRTAVGLAGLLRRMGRSGEADEVLRQSSSDADSVSGNGANDDVSLALN